MADIIAGIDGKNNVRMEIEIRGLYKSVSYGGIVDTGFSGGLVVPLVTAVDIGLEKVGATQVSLADGTIKVVPTFLSQVKLGSDVLDATTLIMGNEVLIGMELLMKHRLCVSAGTGEVTIDEIGSVERYLGMVETMKRIGG